MNNPASNNPINLVWQQLHAQAITLACEEPLLSSYYHASIINHDNFASALAHQLAVKLHSATVTELMLSEVFTECLQQAPSIVTAALSDIVACYERDPACDNYCRPFLYFKGYLAIQAHRFAAELWQQGRKPLARYIAFQTSVLFDVDIHPAAIIGTGIMFDHATGIVIGETAVVGNNVSMLHQVTLGGTGNETGQRHPKIGNGVMISCGAKILGNIKIGDGVKVGGGSLVLESVPEHVTVVGVPAKIMGLSSDTSPVLSAS